MREIVISRPRRFECSAVALKVEVNGKDVAKLKNGQRFVMTADEGAQTIRVHGGFWSGKAFQDTIKIPAGRYSYALQVDFISAPRTNYLPLLRPFGGEHEKDDTRTITLIGATLCKLLLEEKVRDAMRKLPDARLQLMILPTEWRVIFSHEGGGSILFRSEYSHATGGLTAAMVNALEHGDLKTAEGRAKICEKVLNDYVAWLPDYERSGEYGIVFKG